MPKDTSEKKRHMHMGRPKLTQEQKIISKQRWNEKQRERRASRVRLQGTEFELEYYMRLDKWEAFKEGQKLLLHFQQMSNVIACDVANDRIPYGIFTVKIQLKVQKEISGKQFIYKDHRPIVTKAIPFAEEQSSYIELMKSHWPDREFTYKRYTWTRSTCCSD